MSFLRKQELAPTLPTSSMLFILPAFRHFKIRFTVAASPPMLIVPAAAGTGQVVPRIGAEYLQLAPAVRF